MKTLKVGGGAVPAHSRPRRGRGGTGVHRQHAITPAITPSSPKPGAAEPPTLLLSIANGACRNVVPTHDSGASLTRGSRTGTSCLGQGGVQEGSECGVVWCKYTCSRGEVGGPVCLRVSPMGSQCKVKSTNQVWKAAGLLAGSLRSEPFRWAFPSPSRHLSVTDQPSITARER